MNDPCNLSNDAQLTFVPALLKAPCTGTLKGPVTTIGSDWDDIGAVVDHIMALRHVQKVNLVAWSQGGPRAGGYAAQHPENGEQDGAPRACLRYGPVRPRNLRRVQVGAGDSALSRMPNSQPIGIARSAARISTIPPPAKQSGLRCSIQIP